MDCFSLTGPGYDHFDTVPLAKPAFIKVLFHGERGAEQADARNLVLFENTRGGIGDVQ
jgi:hypothetical protein